MRHMVLSGGAESNPDCAFPSFDIRPNSVERSSLRLHLVPDFSICADDFEAGMRAAVLPRELGQERNPLIEGDLPGISLIGYCAGFAHALTSAVLVPVDLAAIHPRPSVECRSCQDLATAGPLALKVQPEANSFSRRDVRASSIRRWAPASDLPRDFASSVPCNPTM